MTRAVCQAIPGDHPTRDVPLIAQTAAVLTADEPAELVALLQEAFTATSSQPA